MTFATRQHGGALIVSLILLLVMTLIGVSAMGTAMQEIRMSSTMQQETSALRRAEAALVTAEDAIDVLASDTVPFEFSTEGDAYHLAEDGVAVRRADWSSISTMAGPVSSDNNEDDDDALVVEYFGATTIPGESIKVNADARILGAVAYTYRNTSRSAAGRNVVRIVQSMYTTLNAP